MYVSVVTVHSYFTDTFTILDYSFIIIDLDLVHPMIVCSSGFYKNNEKLYISSILS